LNKIIRFYIYGILILSFSCSENTQEEAIDWEGGYDSFENSFETKQELESSGESRVLYLRGNSQPFSGTVERNSTYRMSLDEYNAGLLEGKSIRQSADGSWVEANYREGKLHGKMTFYDKNGDVRSVMNYENGAISPGAVD
jgi:antitoxin component YwqK of YwqJK toxin-antitoxin module